MKVVVGSTNPSKIQAVEEALVYYYPTKKISIGAVSVSSGVPDQPLALDETIQGAKNRARNAFKDCDISIGIETGVFHIASSNHVINLTACVIYDGKNFFTGLGPGFEVPNDLIAYMHKKKVDMDTAVYECGYSATPRIGEREGIIGVMTGNKITRKEYTMPAIYMALAAMYKKKKTTKPVKKRGQVTNRN